jgi:signal transduction histidine kinase
VPARILRERVKDCADVYDAKDIFERSKHMTSRLRELESVKAHLIAMSKSLPPLIERVQAFAAQHQPPLSYQLPDPAHEQQRLIAFAAYLDQYGRIDATAATPVDIQAVLADAVALTRSEIERSAVIRLNYLAAPAVMANRHQLGHVLVSLLTNAAQAMVLSDTQPNYIDIELDTNNDGWARIAVVDTGAGIAAEVLPFIFNPLYSTKRGAGMGMGLALALRIIEGLGGRISVESELGLGTMAVVEIPPAL